MEMIRYIDVNGKEQIVSRYDRWKKHKKQYDHNVKNGYFDNHKSLELKDKIFFQLLKEITEINNNGL